MILKFMKPEGIELFDDVASLGTEPVEGEFVVDEDVVVIPIIEDDVADVQGVVINFTILKGATLTAFVRVTEMPVYVLNSQGDTIENIQPYGGSGRDASEEDEIETEVVDEDKYESMIQD